MHKLIEKCITHVITTLKMTFASDWKQTATKASVSLPLTN